MRFTTIWWKESNQGLVIWAIKLIVRTCSTWSLRTQISSKLTFNSEAGWRSSKKNGIKKRQCSLHKYSIGWANRLDQQSRSDTMRCDNHDWSASHFGHFIPSLLLAHISYRYFLIIDATYQGCSSGIRSCGCAGKRMTERHAKNAEHLLIFQEKFRHQVTGFPFCWSCADIHPKERQTTLKVVLRTKTFVLYYE